MLRLTRGPKTLSCPWCLVPRIICDRCAQGPQRKWVETGRRCQYSDVIIPVILVIVEADTRLRYVIDRWMDFREMPSRNLDRLCEWLSQRAEGRPDFYGIRIVEAFWQLEGPWLKRTCTSIGCGTVPSRRWITSTGEETAADRAVDEAAYMAREDERLLQIARTRQNSRDVYELERRIGRWSQKCPISYTYKSSDLS